MCSSQLCEIFCTIFNLSFQSGVVPDIWKTSCIVPVPKNNKVGSMNDLRPVALTSVAFKTCERIVLPQLKSFIHDSLDPFQFAYQSNRSCEDALLVTINEVTSHLDSKLSVKKNKVSGIITKSRNSVRMMFFYFSSAFNTIQTHLLANKMLSMSVPSDMILWITDYLKVTYLHKIDPANHPAANCPLCNDPNHDSLHLFNCPDIPTTLTVWDLWTDPVGVAALLDVWGEKLGGPRAGV